MRNKKVYLETCGRIHVNIHMNLEGLRIREIIIKLIREFFYKEKFREVITPILHEALPLEPNIYAFSTSWNTAKAKKELFFTTSPEATLKKALACGIGNCFSISHCFRNLEGSSPYHNPEFLMLEWYRESATYVDIMGDCERLILYITGSPLDLSSPWKRYSMIDLFEKYAHLDMLEVIDDEKMFNMAKKKGYMVKEANWEQIFNQIFLNEIEPHLPLDPCFITDFPARISPLCKPRKDIPEIAERFEVYMAGMELGNGNTENTDDKSVLKIMKEEEKHREKKGILCPPIDYEFINALKQIKKKSYAGIGMGVERLVMILSNIKDIRELT